MKSKDKIILLILALTPFVPAFPSVLNPFSASTVEFSMTIAPADDGGEEEEEEEEHAPHASNPVPTPILNPSNPEQPSSSEEDLEDLTAVLDTKDEESGDFQLIFDPAQQVQGEALKNEESSNNLEGTKDEVKSETSALGVNAAKNGHHEKNPAEDSGKIVDEEEILPESLLAPDSKQEVMLRILKSSVHFLVDILELKFHEQLALFLSIPFAIFDWFRQWTLLMFILAVWRVF